MHTARLERISTEKSAQGTPLFENAENEGLIVEHKKRELLTRRRKNSTNRKNSTTNKGEKGKRKKGKAGQLEGGSSGKKPEKTLTAPRRTRNKFATGQTGGEKKAI